MKGYERHYKMREIINYPLGPIIILPVAIRQISILLVPPPPSKLCACVKVINKIMYRLLIN